MISIAKSVNMGAIKGGLSTVGYVLKNSNGTVYAARTTSGVVELVTGKGIYGALIGFPDNWSGFIIWDTGDASPYYSIQDYDGRNYAGPGFIGNMGGSAPSWSDKEKKRLFKIVDEILKTVKGIDNVSVKESLDKISKSLITKESSEKVLRETVSVIKLQIEKLDGNQTALAQGIEALIEAAELELSLGGPEDVH